MRRDRGTGTGRSLMDLTFVFCSEEKEFSRTDFLTFYKNLRSLPSGLDSLPKKRTKQEVGEFIKPIPLLIETAVSLIFVIIAV
jgi:hypothetical protein